VCGLLCGVFVCVWLSVYVIGVCVIGVCVCVSVGHVLCVCMCVRVCLFGCVSVCGLCVCD